jgi:carboxymethylenebutenolidase
MHETIALTAEDGHRLSGYRASPAGTPRGGLVVIQEIFGVNPHIQQVCDGFAADGYVALAPAVFDRVERGIMLGYAQGDIERGRAIRDKAGLDAMVMDVHAAVRELAAAGLRVGVVGYCMGGTLAWLAATRIPGIAASVPYYGGGIAAAVDEVPRCPVLLHFGETDASIPPEQYRLVMSKHPTIPTHLYPAGHGFNCDERASYHAPSAVLARQRTLEFFRQHVG